MIENIIIRVRYIFCAYIILIYTLFISYFYKINPVLRKDLCVPFSILHEYIISIKPKKNFFRKSTDLRKISSLVWHIQPQHFLKHSWWSNASKANKYRQLVWIHNAREGNFIILNRIIPLFQNVWCLNIRGWVQVCLADRNVIA